MPAFDRGVHSAETEVQARASGVELVAIPALGKTGWNGGLGSALSEVDLRHIAQAQVSKKVKKQAA